MNQFYPKKSLLTGTRWLARHILLASILVLVGINVAHAVPNTWYLDGVQFDTGATANGSFVYDADSNTFSNIQINVTNSSGTNSYGVIPSVTPGNSTFLLMVTQILSDLTGIPSISLVFDTPLTNDGGTIDITISGFSAQKECRNERCGIVSQPLDRVTAGRVTTTPVWYLEGLQFDTGATAKGSFVYDEDTNTYSNINISVTNSSSTNTYLVLNSGSGSNAHEMNVVQQLLPDLTGQPHLKLSFNSPLGNAGDSVDIGGVGHFSFQQPCAQPECHSYSGFTDILTAGRMTTSLSAPTINSSATASVAENQTSAIDVQATDNFDTEGARLTFSISGGADQALFTIDANTGVVTFIAVPDFENPIDAGGDGNYNIQVTVTDSTGLTAVQNIVVTVTDDVVDNPTPPVITSNGGGDTATVTVAENTIVITNVESTDDNASEGAGLIYFLTNANGGGQDNNQFSINATTGEIVFDNPRDFERPEDQNGDNAYEVQVLVVNNFDGLFDRQDITVMVTDVAENAAPTITTSNTVVSVAENQTSVIDVGASDDVDSEGSGLTFSLADVGINDAALFNIDASNGVITFNAAPDFENPGDNNTDNIYEFRVIVTDSGGLNATQLIVVTVTDTVETWYLEDMQFHTGATATGSFVFDADTETYSNINISISNENTTNTYGVIRPISPSNATFLNTIPELMSDLTGQPRFSLVFAESLTNAGGAVDIVIHTLSSQVECGDQTCSRFANLDSVTSGKVTTVQPTNTAPILAVIGNQTVDEGQLLEFTVSASDLDTGDTLTFQLGNAPTGATLTDNTDGTATFSWTPDFTQTGNYPDVLITVTDSGLPIKADSEAFTITVGDFNRPPQFDALVSQSINEGGTLNFNVQATDPDGNVITLDISDSPSGALFTDNGNGNGTFTWTPGFGQAGNYTVMFTATDSGGLTAVQNIVVTVTDDVAVDTTPPTANPVLNPSPNAAGWNNSDVTINWNWSDETGGSGIDTSICATSNLVNGEGISGNLSVCSDLAGNQAESTPLTVSLDKSAPNTTITANPPATSTTGDASFEFTGSDAHSGISGFECSLDAGGLVDTGPCTSPVSYTALANETYTFSVRAIDVADNVDPTPASYTWTVDVTNPSEPNLLGQWTLDDGIGTIASDTSGNGNDGMVNGAAWTTAGQVDGALDFDGSDDYVDLGNLNASADSLTISAWINADTFTHLPSQDARIVSKASGTASQDHYFMLSTIKSNGGTRLRFRLMTNGATTTLLGSGGVLTSATWIHVAAVYDGAQMRLYQDGVEVGNTSKTGNIDQNAVAVWIGRNPDGKRPFDGRIDEVSIYDQALTATEIADLANTNGGGNQAPTALGITRTSPLGDAPLDVIFDGSLSTDSDGTISTYAWDFGDGSAGSNQQNPTYTYTTAGGYTVTLIVTDNDGATGTDFLDIMVTDSNSSNVAPTAVAAGTPTSGNAPLDVDFDGSGSTDSDGTISTYAWDFGDGSQISNLQNPMHTYNTVGNYTATLTVTDDEGATNTDTVAITVTNPSGLSLVGHWPLDDGSGAIASDSSGNGNDGTVNGAAWTSAGQVEGALDFDGSNDYVDLGNVNAPVDSLTISAWINADTFIHLASQDARIVSKATSTAARDHYFMLSTIKSNGATRLRFRLMTNGLTTTLFGSGGVLTPGTWIHVAAVYDGAQMRLYQDGIQVGSTAKTGLIDSSGAAVWIGRNPDGKRPFDGRIDEVYIYDQALTAAEIAVLANTGSGGNQLPTAVATGTPVSGDARLIVDFDGSGSTDSDGTISTYAWDFGDGSTVAILQNPTHIYFRAGNYTATLMVTDDEGATDTDTVAITVTDPTNSNVAPTAVATGTPTSGNAPLDVDFDGSGSTDSDGTISTYAWDFGDGSQISNLQNPAYIYTTAGIYMATLTVTDDEGATNTDTVTITVTNPSGSSLIGHWTLDDGSGAVAGDSSGNGNDGAVNGAAWINAGQISGALDFDGSDDYVDLGSLNASADSLTISAWINADTFTHLSSQDARIVSKASSTGSQDHYFMLSTIKSSGGTRLRFRLMTNGSTTTLFGSGGVLTSATWIHVAAVYDGAQMRLYQDGVEVGNTSKTGNIDQNAVAVWIGRNPDGKRPFDGRIDEVYIYDQALTAAEIQILGSINDN